MKSYGHRKAIETQCHSNKAAIQPSENSNLDYSGFKNALSGAEFEGHEIIYGSANTPISPRSRCTTKLPMTAAAEDWNPGEFIREIVSQRSDRECELCISDVRSTSDLEAMRALA